MLAVRPMGPEKAGRGAERIDSQAFCTACLLTDLADLKPRAARSLLCAMFFTKLSTESVHEAGLVQRKE